MGSQPAKLSTAAGWTGLHESGFWAANTVRPFPAHSGLPISTQPVHMSPNSFFPLEGKASFSGRLEKKELEPSQLPAGIYPLLLQPESSQELQGTLLDATLRPLSPNLQMSKALSEGYILPAKHGFLSLVLLLVRTNRGLQVTFKVQGLLF